MAKPMFDADALISAFETATAQQGAQLKKAVSDATLASLQGRELTLKNIRAALKAVTDAASAGAAKNLTGGVDAGALLDQAVVGMDQALVKAADLREKHLKKALDDLDKFEDTMFAAVRKAAAGVEGPMAGAWNQVLEKMQAGGTLSGAKASTTVEQLAAQMQDAMRTSRAASMRAAQAMAESYTAMVSGVLLGMSDALQSGAAKKTPAKK